MVDLTSCNGDVDTSLLSHFMNYQNVWKIGGYLVYEGNVWFAWLIRLDIVNTIIANMLYVADNISHWLWNPMGVTDNIHQHEF